MFALPRALKLPAVPSGEQATEGRGPEKAAPGNGAVRKDWVQLPEPGVHDHDRETTASGSLS